MSENRLDGCLFCDVQTIDRGRIIEENDLAFVIRDGFPVSEHHSLFIPKRHVLDYFGLSQDEVIAIHNLIHSQKEYLSKFDSTIDGYNIGMNCGETAGQSVWHCHVHLIPRRKGDTEYPKGGVRHVIAYKGNYEDLR
jgi:diadenosine tetraphosphate (Ap4A) HIT family hydrolase